MPKEDAFDPVLGAILKTHPDNARASSARVILDERKGLLSRGAYYGYALAGAMLLLTLLMAAAENATLTGALAYGAYFWYQTGSSFSIVQPNCVLILRRFGPRAKKKDFVLAKHVGQACRGMAIPLTIQDRSFRGELPIFGKVVRQTIIVPISLLGALAIGMSLRSSLIKTLNENVFVVVMVAVTFVLYAGLYLAIGRAGVWRTNEKNYLTPLERIVGEIHNRKFWTYSGTRVMKFPDAVWRDAVEYCLHHADAVVLDLTDISENVSWEIERAFRLVGPEKILPTWAVDNSEGDRTKLPGWLSERLLQIIPSGEFSNCHVRAYEKRDELGSGFYDVLFAADVALCIAGRRSQAATS